MIGGGPDAVLIGCGLEFWMFGFGFEGVFRSLI